MYSFLRKEDTESEEQDKQRVSMQSRHQFTFGPHLNNTPLQVSAGIPTLLPFSCRHADIMHRDIQTSHGSVQRAVASRKQRGVTEDGYLRQVIATQQC